MDVEKMNIFEQVAFLNMYVDIGSCDGSCHPVMCDHCLASQTLNNVGESMRRAIRVIRNRQPDKEQELRKFFRPCMGGE